MGVVANTVGHCEVDDTIALRWAMNGDSVLWQQDYPTVVMVVGAVVIPGCDGAVDMDDPIVVIERGLSVTIVVVVCAVA